MPHYPAERRIALRSSLFPPLYGLVWTCENADLAHSFASFSTLRVGTAVRIGDSGNRNSPFPYLVTFLEYLTGANDDAQIAPFAVFLVNSDLHFLIPFTWKSGLVAFNWKSVHFYFFIVL